MAFLDEFKISHPKSDDPYITVASYGVTFPTSAMTCMGKPAFIHIYFDDTGKRVAFQPCQKDEDARPFYSPSIKANVIRWSNRRLRDHLCRLAEIKPTKNGIRFDGEYLEDENLLLIDLSKKRKLSGR